MIFNRAALSVTVATCALAPAAAFAHAQLLKAVPSVGSTVTAAPVSISLSFSEPVEPRFCRITLADDAGKLLPLGKPATDPASPTILFAPLKGALKPGTYIVVWQAVSVDTHRTQGKFTFTIAP